MGLGPTLLGGIVGAAVGVLLHLVLETGMLGRPIEASWFAIVIGLLTGLGVRQANHMHMERSYFRGAISGLLALAAIYTSTMLISQVMRKRDAGAGIKPVAAAGVVEKDGADAESAAGDGAEQPATVEPVADAGRPALLTGGAVKAKPSDLNTLQFVFMALGALVAYEFGRGAGVPKPIDVTSDEPDEPAHRGTDPSE